MFQKASYAQDVCFERKNTQRKKMCVCVTMCVEYSGIYTKKLLLSDFPLAGMSVGQS